MKQYLKFILLLQLLKESTSFNVGTAELQGSDGHDEESPIEEGQSDDLN